MNIFSAVMNIDKDSSIYVSSADGFLYSIYKHNGQTRWKLTDGGGFGAGSAVFSPSGETIYIAGHDSNLYALDLDGLIKWKFSCGSASYVPLVDNEGNIYFTTKTDSFGLHSLNPAGILRWRYNFDLYNLNPNHYCPTIDKNGNLYFPALYLYGELRIISVDYSGNFRWEYSFEQQNEDIVVPLICDSVGTIFCGSTWGYYYYAISSDGELLWKLPLDGYQVDNSGAISMDGTLYIGTHLSSLTTGQERTLIAIRDTVTSVESIDNEISNFRLEQNYPNPFNSTTHIRFTIPQSERVTLKCYDLMGGEVATLLDRYQEAGSYDVIFQPKDLASGIYFYTLTSGDFIATKKLILLQ
jgi:outer membrane protein assembly factor BamB